MASHPPDEAITPFTIAIPPSEVQRLRAKLLDTRVPTRDIVHGADNDYGVPFDWITKLYRYYVDEFDWDTAQRGLNEMGPQFVTRIEGLKVHFVHLRSNREGAVPLLLIHGWPATFAEFKHVVRRLAEGEKKGQAFHVVVPSLPGFCWSEHPRTKGWHPARDTARVFHALMTRLGYAGPGTEGYVVQAGDWGQFPARELGSQDRYLGVGGVRAVHLNWCPAPLPSAEDTTEREKGVEGRVKDWLSNHLGYAMIMRSRPQTLGWMIQDNPVGLLVFLGEKYVELSNPKTWYTPSWLEHVCTTTSLYFFTDCIMTSTLPYYDGPKHEQFPTWNSAPENQIKVPLGFTSFLWDSRPSGRKGVAQTGRLVWYEERDEAGHFACLECPVGMVGDLRDFVGRVIEGEYEE